MSDEKSPVLSVPEAGALFGLGRDASYKAAKRGEIPTLKFGRRMVVLRAWIERMLQGEQPVDGIMPHRDKP